MSKQESAPVTHTPGPWRNAGRIGGGIWIKASKQIAVVYGPHVNPSADANARLIAAAPDLLAALDEVLVAFNKGIRSLEDLEEEGLYKVVLAAVTRARVA